LFPEGFLPAALENLACLHCYRIFSSSLFSKILRNIEIDLGRAMGFTEQALRGRLEPKRVGK
jgi:hypothetical protein